MWYANYSDGSVLSQYENGEEHLFKEIDESRLSSFKIVHGSNTVYVFLDDGRININGQFLHFKDSDSEYRLVYFRRTRQNLGTGGVTKGPSLVEYAGWQTTVDNKNRKFMIGLSDDGKVLIDVGGSFE